MSILVICDFDNTLGDTYGPYGEGEIFRTKTDFAIEKSTEIYQNFRRGDDDIVCYKELLDAYGIEDPYEFFHSAGMQYQLFDDSEMFLSELMDIAEVTSAILTTGDEDFQKLKTRITGVDELVDEVFITRDRNKIEHIKTLHNKHKPTYTFFIDDRIHMSSDDFSFPIRIIEMNREAQSNSSEIVNSLHVVLGMILQQLTQL